MQTMSVQLSVCFALFRQCCGDEWTDAECDGRTDEWMNKRTEWRSETDKWKSDAWMDELFMRNARVLEFN
ncbi:unnamed protein product [Brugia pahangi]|uniref:Secreted protein n=1 Tax=Brugia pahangi TaxID=6280 RepID=A0A0N4T455_BRUPA|nr:unnamed protein product [Brugia pahangi]